jgi:geranylgeranyl diphosphate synthase type II
MEKMEELLLVYEKTFGENFFKEGPDNLYAPVNHILNIKGKRIRPLLVLLSCEMFGGSLNEALNPAFAIELFHNFSLVHDDIMDNADMRRGVPTVHKKFGLNAGILAGDVIMAYAYQYLTKISATHLQPVLNLFNDTAIKIFEGQQMDIDFEQRENVSEQEYLKMIEYKTSVLLACSLQTGAILANANEEEQRNIYEFGLNLGLAFQITDDYLDTFGDENKVGKKIGGDILQNKKTYLYITATQSASEKQRIQLRKLKSETDEQKKVSEVKEVFETTGAKFRTQQTANQFFEISLQSLKRIKVNEMQKQPLYQLAEKLNKREF